MFLLQMFLLNVLKCFKFKYLNVSSSSQLSHFQDFWKFFGANLLSGGAAGATTMCFVYPLDFARTRLAVDVGKNTAREFKGLTDCLVKIFRSDGFVGIYRGFSISIFTIIAYRGAYFGLFDTTKTLFGNENELNFLSAWLLAQVFLFLIISKYRFSFDYF